MNPVPETHHMGREVFVANIVHLNPRAVLIQGPKGSIRLFYENHLYCKTEVVPDGSVQGGRTPGLFATADDYVIACMVDQHGSLIEVWPDLARQYLLQDEVRQP